MGTGLLRGLNSFGPSSIGRRGDFISEILSSIETSSAPGSPGRRRNLCLSSRKSLSSIPAFLLSCFPYSICRYSGGREADLNRRTRLLRVDDHCLVRAHIDELVRSVPFSRCKRKFLVFAHFKFLPATPGVNKRRDRLRRRGDLSFHERELCVILLVLEQQLRHIH